MGPVGFEPTTNRLCYSLRISAPLSSLWSGLSLYPLGISAVQSLHLLLLELGSGLPVKVSPNLTEFHIQIALYVALSFSSYY